MKYVTQVKYMHSCEATRMVSTNKTSHEFQLCPDYNGLGTKRASDLSFYQHLSSICLQLRLCLFVVLNVLSFGFIQALRIASIPDWKKSICCTGGLCGAVALKCRRRGPCAKSFPRCYAAYKSVT